MQQLRPEAHSLNFLEFRIYISALEKGPAVIPDACYHNLTQVAGN